MRIYALIAVASGLAQTQLRAQLPTITNQPTSRAVWIGCSVQFGVGATGAGPLNYQWQLNGTNLPNGIITTVAGGGPIGHGYGGAATNAGLVDPSWLTIDASGNLYFPDSGLVFKMSTSGIIKAVAGNGTYGYGGDGGPATNASFNEPRGLAVDSQGNLYIADYWNNRVRKVMTDGIINTIAGNGVSAYSGDGGPATNASLNLPCGLLFDHFGNLIIVDCYNNVVREIDDNGIITTIAGNGQQGYAGDGGAATNASLYYPTDIAEDAWGNLFIADDGNFRIREVFRNGIITTVVAQAEIDGGVAADASDAVIYAEGESGLVQRMTTNGTVATVAGNGTHEYFSGDGGPATNASLNGPEGLVEDSLGNLFIADSNNGRIRKVTNTQGGALALNNAMPGNAGGYQVIVTGTGGSVTSSVASLTVAMSPLIYGAVHNADGDVTLFFVSQPGSTNVVFSAPSLSRSALWQPMYPNVAGPDGDWQYTDTNTGSQPARFYRSLTQ